MSQARELMEAVVLKVMVPIKVTVLIGPRWCGGSSRRRLLQAPEVNVDSCATAREETQRGS